VKRCFSARLGLLCAGSLSLLVAAAFLHQRGGTVDAASPQVILEVTNRHFTVGKKIPSVYLRVYADGTAECHTEKYWDEPDVVNRKTLAPDDFEKLKKLLDEPSLLTVQHRFERMYPVVDSWMEWTIKIPHSPNAEIIQIAGFSPSAARERNQPYPDIVLKLGCSIQRLRGDVYGDAPPESDECKAVRGYK
jgi:hypothetical protein